jgi:type IV pilus assembly protein PilQ
MHRTVIGIFLILLFLPLCCYGQVGHRAPTKVSLDFMDADIRNVFRILTEVSGKNIVIGDDVKGRVTLRLDDVPWEEAMDVVIKNNDLAKIEEDNVIRIVSVKKFLDEKDKERKERLEFLKEKETREKLEEDFVQETVFVNYVDVAEIEKMMRGDESKRIKGLLSANGTVTSVKWTNALIVKDTKGNLEEIKKRIKEHDVKPAQVQIEARIVQATSTFARDIGVQWGASYASRIRGEDYQLTGGKTTGPGGTSVPTVGQSGVRDSSTFPYNVNLPAAVGPGSGGVLGVFVGSATDSLQLDVQLSALESEGKVKIISHPKVVTSDNKPAKINQGKQIPYQTVSQQGTQTQFVDAYLGLEVTPQVTKDGNIRLKVVTSKDSADFRNSTVAGPTIDKKVAQTEIIIRDGETAVIGGIYETTEENTVEGVPFLSKVPLLGWLFKKDFKNREKSELLVFITPTILRNLYAERD